MKILNFGSLNLDHTYNMEHFVRPAETVSALDYNIYFGGKGHNQSIALAKAGADVWHAGHIGADGASILANMQNHGVHTEYTTTIETPTGHAMIQVDKNGQNSIIVYSGANGKVGEAFADEVISQFSGGDVLLLQNEISSIPYIMAAAKKRGMRIVLNPSPCNDAVLQFPLALVDVFVMNEVEGEILSGETEPQRILSAMQQKYPAADIILTLGDKGAYYAANGETLFQPIFETDVVDTTAAGDTFTGYFFAWLLGGKPAQEALAAAAMASSIAVSVAGASSSVPDRDVVVGRL